jgi:hypothetical protein
MLWDKVVGRILRLTLLAPDIVDAIASGRQSGAITLATLMQVLRRLHLV